MSTMATTTPIPNEDLMHSGHTACAGCAAALSLRLVLKAIGQRTVVVVPACCSTIIVGQFPMHTLEVPVYHCAFASAASTASGFRAGLDAMGQSDTTVLAWAGDGGTFDIGLQALSSAAERNERIIYVCYDNEAYMMTGVQRSSATPVGAWTTTTPVGQLKQEPKKHLAEIMAGHRIPYMATATPAFPADLIGKFQTAKATHGMSFIHLLTPCPTGWRSAPENSVKLSRLAVESRLFPLYEVRNGIDYRLTVESKGTPIKEYLRLQGRYSHFKDEDYLRAQQAVDEEWRQLSKRFAG